MTECATQAPIFLDHAGSSRPSDAVVERQCRHLRLEQLIGGYAAAEAVRDEVASAREALGLLVGAAGTAVALGESSSVLWSRALNLASLKPGSKIIVTSYEYGSNLISLAALVDRHSLAVEIVEADENGQVSADKFRKALEDGTSPSLALLCHIPTSFGITVDVSSLAAMAKRLGALVFIDACQSVGQIDTKRLMVEADVIVCSGRKFIAGPRGTGFAAVSERFLQQMQLSDADICGARLNSDLQLRVESRIGMLERWEGNIAGILGLGVAAQEALTLGSSHEYNRRMQLAGMLRTKLQNIKKVRVLESADFTCSTTTFVVEGMSPSQVVNLCRVQGAIISEVEVYTAPLDLPKRVGSDVNRISLGHSNTEADISAFAEILEQVVSGPK